MKTIPDLCSPANTQPGSSLNHSSITILSSQCAERRWRTFLSFVIRRSQWRETIATMKCGLWFVFVISLTSLSAWASGTNDIGRYQLFSGPNEEVDSSGRTQMTTAVFRIDTVTGQTWVYNKWLIKGPQKPDGQFAEGWVSTTEDFQVSLYLATGVARGWQEAHTSFTNLFASTNALSQAMNQMYWPPKRRDEFEALVAEAAVRLYLQTNRQPETVWPSVSPTEKGNEDKRR